MVTSLNNPLCTGKCVCTGYFITPCYLSSCKMQPEFFYIASSNIKVELKYLYEYAKKSRNFDTGKSP